jgi:hypothetical protein
MRYLAGDFRHEPALECAWRSLRVPHGVDSPRATRPLGNRIASFRYSISYLSIAAVTRQPQSDLDFSTFPSRATVTVTVVQLVCLEAGTPQTD